MERVKGREMEMRMAMRWEKVTAVGFLPGRTWKAKRRKQTVESKKQTKEATNAETEVSSGSLSRPLLVLLSVV